MNISKKWSTAAVAALALALVAGGASSANAAEGDISNPQPNGSPGSFYLWDGGTGEFADGDPTRVYTRDESIIGAASKTDVLAEINPSATRPVTGSTPFTGVYKFLSDRNATDLNGGTATWNAYSVDGVGGPNGGTLTPDMSMDALINGIDTVIAAGGDYWYGVAYTDNAGVTTVGAVYREITIAKGTGSYTVGPVEVDGPTVPNTVVEADLTPALEVPTLVTATVDSTIVAINAGVANANKTLKVGAFSSLTDLGQVTLDAAGKAAVDLAGKGFVAGDAHKLFLAESDNTVVAWDSFTLVTSVIRADTTDLTVNVTTSNRFELKAPVGQSVNLGDVKRNKTTSDVALGQFSVVDDRDVLLGWNLNVTASDFTGPNGAKIDKAALGYAPVVAGVTQDGVTLGAAKVAGAGSFGKLVDGAVNSSTTEDGAVFDAKLTFKAPAAAVKGAYNSTLTLDLVSK